MDKIKTYAGYAIALIIIVILFKCESDNRAESEYLKSEQKASKQREENYRMDIKALQLDRAKRIQQLEDLKAANKTLKALNAKIAQDEKERLDTVDHYTSGELEQFFAERYGK